MKIKKTDPEIQLRAKTAGLKKDINKPLKKVKMPRLRSEFNLDRVGLTSAKKAATMLTKAKDMWVINNMSYSTILN